MAVKLLHEGLLRQPKLVTRFIGGKAQTRRAGHPKLQATLTARKGDANIARAAVTLPRSLFLAQNHIRTVCTRVQFAAKACPAGSIYTPRYRALLSMGRAGP